MAKPSSGDYARKLQDPRWQKRRLEILEKAGWECENCGNASKTLHVHHKHYEWGRDPWEYPDENLECLCSECHEQVGMLQKALKREISGLSSAMLDRTLGYIRGLREHWDYCLAEDDKKILVENHEQAMGLADCFGCDVDDVISLVGSGYYVTARELDENSRLAKKKA